MEARKLSVRVTLALLALLFLALPACGDDDGTAQPEPGTNGQNSGEADPESVIRVGYDLVASTRGGIRLNPAEAQTGLGDNGLYYLIFGALLRPTLEGSLEPDLAESTEVTDPNTIEITLREGLSFADGDPLDAEAVKASLERSLAVTDSPAFNTNFFNLETVEVTSPTTLTLTIPNGTAASWHDSFLGSFETAIVPEDIDVNAPKAAGPMMVTEYRPETSLMLEKNPEYWNAEEVKVAGIEFVNAPDAQAGVSALSAGQVDMTNPLEPSQIAALPSQADTIITPDPYALMNLSLCKRDAPLDDPQVRLALNKALDREAINEAVFEGTYTPAHGLWPDDHQFHNPDVTPELQYDPEGAQELLAEAGYEDGVEFDVYVLQGGGMPEVMEVIQQQYEEVGIRINIIPSPNYVNDFLVPKKPGAGAVPVSNVDKLNQFSGDAIGNICDYDDPELNELRQELGQVSASSDEAVELWHEIEEKVVVEDALGVFILFGSTVVSYDTERLGDAALLPYVLTTPDVFQTFVKAG